MGEQLKNEQKCDEIEEQKSIMKWIKGHKKQLIIIGISIPSLLAIVVGIKNKDELLKLMNNLKKEIEKVELYSPKWFKEATEAELNSYREKIRIAYCNAGSDYNKARELEKLRGRFDKELRERAWGDEIPHAPRIHREHGYYLLNDD